MKNKWLRKVVFSFLAVPLFLLSTARTLAIIDLGILPDPALQAVGINDRGPSFISTALLVKFTPQARANLKVTDEDVNPKATGVPSLDVICREHGVNSFRSIVNAGEHRNAAAAINSWHKLTLAGLEQRLTLVEVSN